MEDMHSLPPAESLPATSAPRIIGLQQWFRRNPLLGACLLLATLVLLFYVLPITFTAVRGARGSSGPQWQSAGLPGITVHYLALGHTHPNLAFAATERGVYRRNGTGSWHHILSASSVWSIALAPDDRTVVAGDNNGDVYVSHDAGQRWSRASVNPQGVFAVAMVPGHPRRILAGAGLGLYLSRDGGHHWQRHLRLPGSAGAAFAWLPGSSRVVFAGIVAGAPNGETRVFVSRDAGKTWHVFGRGLQSGGGIMSLLVTRAGHIYTGTMGRAVWTTSLLAGHWQQVAQGMPLTNDHGAGLASDPAHPGTVFVATLGHGVFRTTDGGRHWTNISQGLPSGDNEVVLSLAYSQPRHTLIAGTLHGVYKLSPQ